MTLRLIGTRAVSLASRAMSSSTSGRLEGKVAIVTASTDGIGYAIAKRLADDGAKVMISSRKDKNVKKALDSLYGSGISKDRLKGVVCHVGTKEDRTKLVQETLKDFGAIDILVSNAATNPVMGNSLDCPEDAWDKIFDVNVKAPFLLTQEIQPYIVKRNGGSIIFVSSIAGFQPFSVLGPYSVSKTALLGLTKVLAQELGPDNIRVNCVAPGVIETKFSQMLTNTPEIAEKMLEMTSLKRFGKPEEIAGVVSFLCSNDASYITGENLVAAGGQPSRL